MKLIYLTSKKYPGKTADHNFVKNIAREFSLKLGEEFLFVVADYKGNDLEKINYLSSEWKMERGKSFFYFFWILRLYFRNRKEDVVFFSNDPYLLLILIFWKGIFRFRYKIVSDWHQMWQDLKDRIIAQGSDLLITTSERLKDNLVRKTGVMAEKILVARGGANIPERNISELKVKKFIKLKIREELDLPVDEKLVGYVGGFKTMGMEKGVKTLIESFHQLKVYKVNLVLVGGKEEEVKEYKELAEKEGVLERVIFRGWQTEESLLEYEQAMDILVIPYLDEPHFREWGFPMKVYEYMASGTPIIYSDLEIIREVLEEKAVSFKAGDAGDLAEKIKFLIEDKNKGEKMAKEAMASVKNFTWESRTEKIINFVRENEYILYN
ncbi:MAG: hypothetical protein A2430_02055 [Candidatus Liptonbacteria bacterium RIFOXYC1_FULL_36_8]|uniref:Glycosyl transferase family 1 domain-containing protein n=2 Tax=Candidatus Liptoniibacteriota TaxID=1817909 RepID=A0A1G2CM07_9BACT|nr:MAG: hypothetical protein A2390_02785 [Candidatus Liptonbacteria bacterium RIFOXYB1_FULL_36_10]OGZ03513.1 MAG: hypothetical protein A2430_02055 [Candidatus Liptonbacteria bacterium RIFOXYC1_FULL_36_8]